jgi:hypothetical protein
VASVPPAPGAAIGAGAATGVGAGDTAIGLGEGDSAGAASWLGSGTGVGRRSMGRGLGGTISGCGFDLGCGRQQADAEHRQRRRQGDHIQLHQGRQQRHVDGHHRAEAGL